MLIDKHIKLEVEDLERLKRLCLHKGDLSYHINCAIKSYLVEKEEEERELVKLRLEKKEREKRDV